MFDSEFSSEFATGINVAAPQQPIPAASRKIIFLGTKRAFDVATSLALLPFLAAFALVLCALNPFFNKGPLFFVQIRMGRNCRAFPAIKFRTMVSADRIVRGPDDPLETDRITRLGHFLRKARIDELPQILNVLMGHMSLIGPRPDYFPHARHYVRVIPGYRERHAVRPGISGLAQTYLGYAHGVDATVAKVRADIYYIRHAGFRMDARIFVKTLLIVFGRRGC